MLATSERCRTRPLPSGRITVFKATVFLFIQYAIGVIFLSTTVPGGLAFVFPVYNCLLNYLLNLSL